jgi:hypothetical protein
VQQENRRPAGLSTTWFRFCLTPLGKGPCRGVIVAKEISDDLVLAPQRVQGVSLYRYKLSVSVEKVSKETVSDQWSNQTWR